MDKSGKFVLPNGSGVRWPEAEEIRTSPLLFWEIDPFPSRSSNSFEDVHLIQTYKQTKAFDDDMKNVFYI